MMAEKVVAIVQARMGSSRLPGKVLLDLGGAPVLGRVVARLRRARRLNWMGVATTTDPSDGPLAEFCAGLGLPCWRGSTLDVLDRFVQAGRAAQADVVVRITADCPLIDPEIIDTVLQFNLAHPNAYDYVSNLHPATFPDGNDVEVVPLEVLHAAWFHADKPFEREHTTPYIWDNPSKFYIGNVNCAGRKNYSMTHRWTLDYPEDYEFVKSVYERLYPENPFFTTPEILALLEAHPEICAINEGRRQR